MKNINIPNIEKIDGYVILISIIKYDFSEEFIIPNYLYDKILAYYNFIRDLYKNIQDLICIYLQRLLVIIYI